MKCPQVGQITQLRGSLQKKVPLYLCFFINNLALFVYRHSNVYKIG